FYKALEANYLADVGVEGKPGKLTVDVNKRFDALEARLVRLGELAVVLRLPEWGVPETIDGVVWADMNKPKERPTGMVDTLGDRFVDAVKAAAKADRQERIALCVLLGEEANEARKKKNVSVRRVLIRTVPVVASFSKETGAENRPLREAATTALSLLDA